MPTNENRARSSMLRTAIAAGITTASLAGYMARAEADTIDRNALEDIVGEPVTLSATGAPLRATDAPVTMTIITQAEIRQSGARDIPSVLERLAPVDVDRYSSGDAEVSVRGYNQPYAPRLLVLVNGRQVYLDHYSNTVWGLIPIPLSEIRQIEIVSGPNTALFGFNAVAGVVNIITFDPLSDAINSAEVTTGSDNYRSGNFVLTGRPAENIAARLSARVEDGDSPESEQVTAAAAPYFSPAPGINDYAVNVQISARLIPQLRADLEAGSSHNRRLEVTPEMAFADTSYDATTLRGVLSADTEAGLFEGQAYYNTLDATFREQGLPLRGSHHVLVASGSWTDRVAPNHTLRLAAEYRQNWGELNGGPGGIANADLNYDVYAASAMWHWAISESLSSTIAARIDTLRLERDGPATSPFIIPDNSPRTLTEPSYNAGLVWRPTEVDTLRFASARGVQSPSLVEFGLEVDLGGGLLISLGDHNLKPTIVENYEVSWDHDISAIDGQFRLSVYHQTNDDLKNLFGQITTGPLGAPPITLLAANIGSSDLTGVDASLQGAQGGFDWRLMLSHRDIDDDLMNTSLVPFDYDGTTPSDVATATLGKTWGALQFDVALRHVSRTTRQAGTIWTGFSPESVDAYNVVNANLTWRAAEHMTVSLAGRNLFDDETQTTAHSPYPRSFYLTLSSTF